MIRLLANLARRHPPDQADEGLARSLAGRLDAAARARFGRTLAIRHLEAGGCNGCLLELRMLEGAVNDLRRHGLSFVASPRHADVLLVTGPMTTAMVGPARRCWEAMASDGAPRWVVAAGDCAIDGGVFRSSPAVAGGAAAVLPVDVLIRGCPPTPVQFIQALLALVSPPPRSRPQVRH